MRPVGLLLAFALLMPLSARAADTDTLDEIEAPKPDTENLGADYIDADLKFVIPSPGPDWLRISPVPNSPGVRVAFMHIEQGAVRAILAVTVDTKPIPKDLIPYVKQAVAPLTSPPLSFTIQKKTPVKIAGEDAFVIDYLAPSKVRRYEQLYVPVRSGAMAVMTFQAPTSTFDSEVSSFRDCAKKFQP